MPKNRVFPGLAVAMGLFFALAFDVGAQEKLRVVMLGDSLTAGFNWAAAFPGAEVVNLGHSGDTTRAILERLDAVEARQPEMIFLQAGINDLGRMEKRKIILQNHLKIWDELRRSLPAAKLRVVSLLPVAGERFTGWNQAVRDLNHRLSREADSRGIPFIDLYPALSDHQGRLRAEFTTDGLHLKGAAYDLWAAALAPYINEGK